jgi:hypothetical protein
MGQQNGDGMTDIIPANYRKPAYAVYATIGAILTAVQIWIASTSGTAQPDWLLGALAVYTFLGTAFGLVARANVQEDVADPGE